MPLSTYPRSQHALDWAGSTALFPPAHTELFAGVQVVQDFQDNGFGVSHLVRRDQ